MADLTNNDFEPLRITMTKRPEEEKGLLEHSFNALNFLGIQVNEPDLQIRAEHMSRTGVDVTDPKFASIYERSDSATKQAMLNARNNEDAYRIAGSRAVQAESMEAFGKENILTQLAVGAPAALLTPTTLLPAGSLFKAASVATKARKIKMAAVGAGTATVANLIDEAMIGKQGLETNYLGVAGASIVLGGGAGYIGALLTGTNKTVAANHFLREGDVISAEKATDNFILADVGTETILIPKQDKNLIDKIPYLGEWLASPITRLFQSDNEAVRQFAARISNPTVALKDKEGNYVIMRNKTGAEEKLETQGMYNTMVNQPISELFNQYKANGGTGTRGDFNIEIHRLYNEEATRLRNNAKQFADENSVDALNKIDEEYKAAVAEAKAPTTYYKGANGKELPAAQEVVDAYEASWAKYKDEVEQLRVIKEEQIPAIDAQVKVDIELVKELLKAEGLKGKELTERMKLVRQDIRARATAEKKQLRSSVKPKRPKEIQFYDKKPGGNKAERKELAAKLQELRIARREGKKAAREKYVDDFYANNEIKFNTSNQFLAEGANVYAKYFDEMLAKGQGLGIKQLEGIRTGRLYSPRNWDFKRLTVLDKDIVVTRLKNALTSDARNEYSSDAELLEAAEDLYKVLMTKEIQSELGNGKGYYTKDLPLKARLKEKGLNLDDSKLGDLLYNNFEDVAGMYSYFMSGRYGVQRAFGDYIKDDNLGSLSKAVIEEAQAKGEITAGKDLELLTDTIDDLLGTLRSPQFGNDAAWQFSRNLRSYNSLRLMGGAGGNQLIEIATITAMMLAKGIVTKNFGATAKRVAKMLFLETADSSDLARVLLDQGYMESALHAHRANRIADTEAGFNPNMLERGLDSLTDFQMKYNGQRFFTAFAEDLTGANIIQIIKKASNKDEGMFSRWGLSMEDVQGLKKVFDKNDEKFLNNMTPKQRALFQQAIRRGVAEWVVQPNSMHLPNWFKKAGPIGKLVFQFMKFPMIAQETLLRRGFAEDKAGMAAGIFGAVTMYTTLKYLREEAAVSLGFKDEIDRKYDIFNDEEHMKRAMLESVNYIANLGMLTTVWNYGAIGIQRPELGREWASDNVLESLLGPSASLVQDLSDTAKRAVDGDFTSEQQLNSYRSYAPFMSLPMISEAGKALAEEYGD